MVVLRLIDSFGGDSCRAMYVLLMEVPFSDSFMIVLLSCPAPAPAPPVGGGSSRTAVNRFDLASAQQGL